MNETIKKIIRNKYLVIIILCLGGLILLFLSKTDPETKNVESISQEWNYEYITSLESRIESIVSTINGAGKCDVMINLLSSEESVYVKESKKSQADNKTESEDSVLTMTDSSGNESAVVTKKIMPEITGVIISCDGGNIPQVKSEITNAVSTLLGIGSNNICVTANNIK